MPMLRVGRSLAALLTKPPSIPHVIDRKRDRGRSAEQRIWSPSKMFQKALLPISLAAALFALTACGSDDNSSPAAPTSPSAPAASVSPQDAAQTATPIKHLVVIFQENRSFDHYFGTYPNATNPAGEPAFTK